MTLHPSPGREAPIRTPGEAMSQQIESKKSEVDAIVAVVMSKLNDASRSEPENGPEGRFVLTRRDIICVLTKALDDSPLLADPPAPGEGTPHQPIPGDSGVTLWNGTEPGATNTFAYCGIKIDGQEAALWSEDGMIRPGVTLKSQCGYEPDLPRRIRNPKHDPVDLVAFAAKVRASRAAAKPPTEHERNIAPDAPPAEKPLWREDERFRNPHFPRPTHYWVHNGSVRAGSPTQHGGCVSGTYQNVESFEAAIKSGELVPVDAPPSPPAAVAVPTHVPETSADVMDRAYKDIKAFENWMSNREGPMDPYSPWEGLDSLERLSLYSLACDLIDRPCPWLPATPMAGKEVTK